MKKDKIQKILSQAIENAKYDRDVAMEFLEAYRKEELTSYDVNNSGNLSKVFEALARSNDQIIKASSEMLKVEKEFQSTDEEEEEDSIESLYERFEKEV